METTSTQKTGEGVCAIAPSALLIRGVEVGKYYDRWWWVEYLRGIYGKENEVIGDGSTRWYRSGSGIVVGYRVNWGMHPAVFVFGISDSGKLEGESGVLGRVEFSFERVEEICGVLEAIGSGDLALCVGVEWFSRVLEAYARLMVRR